VLFARVSARDVWPSPGRAVDSTTTTPALDDVLSPAVGLLFGSGGLLANEFTAIDDDDESPFWDTC
jgi:hypothetical protein